MKEIQQRMCFAKRTHPIITYSPTSTFSSMHPPLPRKADCQREQRPMQPRKLRLKRDSIWEAMWAIQPQANKESRLFSTFLSIRNNIKAHDTIQWWLYLKWISIQGEHSANSRGTLIPCATLVLWTLMQQLNIDPYVMTAEEVYNILLRIESNRKKNALNNSLLHICILYTFIHI